MFVNLAPELIWSDGDSGPVDYWRSTKFLAWLYNESPVKDKVVVNDRWGFGTPCKHGGFLNCDDRYNPGTKQSRKWENAMTLDKRSWGYRRNAQLSEYLTIKELLLTLVQTVAKGGNILINVGPTKEGTIPVIMQERLKQLGDWLSINGEAIYKTKPWVHVNDSSTHDVYYTSTKDLSSTYAIFFQWPVDNLIILIEPEPSQATCVYLIGPSPAMELKWKRKSGYFSIWLPDMSKAYSINEGISCLDN